MSMCVGGTVANYSMESYYDPQEWKLWFPRRQRGMGGRKILFLFLLLRFNSSSWVEFFVPFEGWFIYPFECHVLQLNHFGRNSTRIKDSHLFPSSSFLFTLCKCQLIRNFRSFLENNSPPTEHRLVSIVFHSKAFSSFADVTSHHLPLFLSVTHRTLGMKNNSMAFHWYRFSNRHRLTFSLSFFYVQSESLSFISVPSW